MKHGPGRRLVDWYERGHRDLPWRRSADPYRIWVSEIMLQQTRAAAVMPYYERFLSLFPTVEALARAPEDQVLAAWSGLGYYSRARNLLRAARQVADAGEFPRTSESLLALAGIGDYTAAAVASIAFGEARAVVDGNVLRVVSRVLNDASDIGSPATRGRFRDVAQQWMAALAPGIFNQALMELGATVCLPRNPQCAACPLRPDCAAHGHGTVAQLPVKLRRQQPVRLEESVLLVRSRGRILLRRREPDARRMAGFWELPGLEDLPQARLGHPIGEFRHTITHHHYRFVVLAASMPRLGAAAGSRFFSVAEIVELPITTVACKALQLAGIAARPIPTARR